MQTKTTSAVADNKIEVALDVRLAVENAPSYAALAEATAKLTGLNTVARDEQELIDRLTKQQDSGADNKISAARDLLAGKAIEDKDIKDSIASAHRRLGVAREAIAIQTRIVQGLQVTHGGEVNAALKKMRQPLVSRMSAALKELRAAAAEDAQIATVLSQHGIRGGDSISFVPVSAYCAWDEQWYRGAKAMRYTV